MDEFIKKLIRELKEEFRNVNPYMSEFVIDIINKVAEEYNNGWIPCSERLPEENGWHLVTNELGVVHQQRWGANHWQKLRDEAVIAWQPLPEPYKPKEQPHSTTEAWKQQTMSRFERVE